MGEMGEMGHAGLPGIGGLGGNSKSWGTYRGGKKRWNQTDHGSSGTRGTTKSSSFCGPGTALLSFSSNRWGKQGPVRWGSPSHGAEKRHSVDLNPTVHIRSQCPNTTLCCLPTLVTTGQQWTKSGKDCSQAWEDDGAFTSACEGLALKNQWGLVREQLKGRKWQPRCHSTERLNILK